MKLEEKFIRREIRLKLLTVLILFTLAVVVILAVENMLISFVLAFVITYTLNPAVTALERAGMDRTLAIIIPYFAIAALIGAGIYLASPLIGSQIAAMKDQMPAYIDGLTKILNRLNSFVSSFAAPLVRESMSDKVVLFLQNWAHNSLQDIPGLAGRIFTVTILAPFFAFFMLRDGRNISRGLLSIVPNNLFELFLNLFHQINVQMGGFIRARALEAVIVGAVVWAGLAIIGFPYSVILGAFAGITNLIPYIGPVIGAVPAFVIAMVNKDSSFLILLMSSVYFAAQLIDMLVIIPLVVAKIVNLHPVTVVIVIIIGSQLMGILGMIISIPVASALKLTTSAIYNHVIGFRI